MTLAEGHGDDGRALRAALTTVAVLVWAVSLGYVLSALTSPPRRGDGPHAVKGRHCGCLNNNGDCDMPCSECCKPPPCKGSPTSSECCSPITSGSAAPVTSTQGGSP